jgi:hypothetical protein
MKCDNCEYTQNISKWDTELSWNSSCLFRHRKNDMSLAEFQWREDQRPSIHDDPCVPPWPRSPMCLTHPGHQKKHGENSWKNPHGCSHFIRCLLFIYGISQPAMFDYGKVNHYMITIFDAKKPLSLMLESLLKCCWKPQIFHGSTNMYQHVQTLAPYISWYFLMVFSTKFSPTSNDQNIEMLWP